MEASACPATLPNGAFLPAMKAIYRDAGLQFPEVDDTTGDAQANKMARRRAEVIEKSKELIKAERQRKQRHG